MIIRSYEDTEEKDYTMKVMLQHTADDPVRLAFAHLFQKRPGMKNDDGTQGKDKFEATIIVKPGGTNAKKIEDAIVSVASEKWGTDQVDELNRDGEKTGKKVPAWKAAYGTFEDDQKGLRKGNLKKNQSGEIYDGFEDNLYVVAKNETRPGIYDRDTSPLVEEDGRPYSGCFVNAEIDVWALAKRGVKKRIVNDLLGIQFVKDGDAFGAGSAPSKPSSFASLSAADDTEQSGGLLD